MQVSRISLLIALFPLLESCLAKDNSGNLTATIVVPLFTVIPTFCLYLWFKRNKPKSKKPSVYVNILGVLIWVDALLLFSCAGSVVNLKKHGNKPFHASYVAFLVATGVLTWVWVSAVAAGELVERSHPTIYIALGEAVLWVFSFCGSCAASARIDGEKNYCKSFYDDGNECSTYQAAVAFSWFLTFLVLCKLVNTVILLTQLHTLASQRSSAGLASSDVYKVADVPIMIHKEQSITSGQWQKHTDQQTGMEYYFNVITGETTWRKPHDFA